MGATVNVKAWIAKQNGGGVSPRRDRAGHRRRWTKVWVIQLLGAKWDVSPLRLTGSLGLGSGYCWSGGPPGQQIQTLNTEPDDLGL